ncbi:hypothetical protein RIF29_26755 [Crotalaria pallida]|uniref:NB-ARC domain-containing protein n=1 Tax=Crotalaria pallida TaxID=3830 RepID=A0AAN9ENM9_CROPI
MRRTIPFDGANNAWKKLRDYLCGGFKPTITVEDDWGKEKRKYIAVESLPGIESLRSQDFIHFESRELVYKQLLEAMEGNYMTGLHGTRGIDKLELSLEGKNGWERIETISNRFKKGEKILLILDDVRENINLQDLGIPSTDNNMKCRVLVTSCDKKLCKLMGCQRRIQLEKLPFREAWKLFKEHVGLNDNFKDVQDIGKEITLSCAGLPGKIMIVATILKGHRSLEDWLTISRAWESYGYNEKFIKVAAFFELSHDKSKIDQAKWLTSLLFMFPRNSKVSMEMLTRLVNGLGLLGEVEKYSKVRSEVFKIKNILKDSLGCFEEDKEGYVKMWDWVWDEWKRYTGYRYLFYYQWTNVSISGNSTFNAGVGFCFNNLLAERMDKEMRTIDLEYGGVKMLLINVEASTFVEVSKEVFEKFEELRVLSLSSNNLHRKVELKLPPLANIRSLILCHWKLGDISILGSLQSLDTLDFDDCSIYELPEPVSRLKLILLSLKRCQIERNNPFKVIERCLSLQEIYYEDNDLSKESIHDDGNEAEEIKQNGTFPALNSMNDEVKRSMESCLKVECLVNSEHIESSEVTFFSRLAELKLANMDNFKELCCGVIPFDFLKSLERLCIEQCGHLQGILFKNKVKLCNLKSINLFDCRELTSLFQLSTAHNLVLLEELRIRECMLLTNIIEDENDRKSDALFPKLKTLEIESCDQLQCILRLAFPEDIPLLKNMKISKCPLVKHIFQEEHVVSCSLEKVELSGLSNFIDIYIECYSLLASPVKASSPGMGLKSKQQEFSNGCHHKFKSASKIKIPVNDGLTDDPISSMSNSECLPPNERTQCPPKHSPGLNKLVVHNIKQLVLRDLEKIKYLFTLSTASSMILIIDSCHELKHIINIGDRRDGKNFDVVFSKLKELSVSKCDELKCMFGEYPLEDQYYNDHEIHINLPTLEKLILQNLSKFSLSSMTWPYLKEFTLVQCPKVIINPISDMMIHKDSRKLIRTIITDIREIDKKFLYLETLNLECIKVMNSSSIFCLNRLPELIGQVRFGLRCIKFRELPDELLNIFVGCRNSFIFQNLKRIQLFDCHKLEVIFPASVVHYLPELEHLEIKGCENLKQIIEEVEEDKTLRNNNLDSPQPLFPKLAEFVVHDCDKLKHLIPIFDICNVKTVKIYTCYGLEAIFHASSVSCLPELEHLEIKSCMGLKKIIEEVEEDKTLGNNNLDSHKPLFPKLAVFVVNYCYFNLKRLIPIFDIPKVKIVKINECDVLEAIFPASSVSCLPELDFLSIKGCDGLKHIIEEVEDNDDKILANEACFPNLTVLLVNKCPKLKHLFSAATYNDVPNLETLIIIECEGLKELMGGGVSMEKMNIELKLLMFIDLPSLCDERIDALQNIVRHRLVYKCPKLSLTSNVTQEKALELGEGYSYPSIDDTGVGNSDEEVKTEFPLGAEAQTASGSDLPSSSQQFMEVNSSPAPSNLTQVNEESPKESVGEVPDSKIPATSSISPTHGDRIESQSPSSPTHKTHLHEMVDEQSMSEPCLINQQKPIGETDESTIEISQSIVRDAKEGTTSDNIKIVTSSTNLESAGSESYPHTSTNKDSEDHKINIKDSPAVEEDGPFVSDVEADNLGVKVLADLEESLKKPLKEIACTEANNQYHLLAALKFLSNSTLEDETLSDGLKASIVLIRKEFPSILYSFKQAYATINKFPMLESHLNEETTKLVSKISDAKKKEATLKQQIIRLGKQIEDCETEISSLEEEQKKCIAEIKGYEKEYENVKKEKTKMLEDQTKARKELREVEYRWSVRCSQFELSHLAARNPS